MTHIGQGDDWWQSAPGKLTAPTALRWESGEGGSAAIYLVYIRYSPSYLYPGINSICLTGLAIDFILSEVDSTIFEKGGP